MHRLVSHEYFMDEMRITELAIITKYIDYSFVLEWNMTRNIMLSALRPYLKKKNIKANEFWPLPIDEGYYKEELTQEVDPKAIKWFDSIKGELEYKKGSK